MAQSCGMTVNWSAAPLVCCPCCVSETLHRLFPVHDLEPRPWRPQTRTVQLSRRGTCHRTHSFAQAFDALNLSTPACITATQVLAWQARGRIIGVVDLNDNYTPKSLPTLFNSTLMHLPDKVDSFEDPRLFIYRGEMYLSTYGFGYRDRPRWQYLARLERRSSAAADVTTDPADPAGFRLVQPRRVLLPESPALASADPADIDSVFRKAHPEKNWMPFIYNDSIHWFRNMNPLVVVRVLPDLPHARANADIRTELVALGGNGTRVRWRWGEMRGGTAAVYDAALGAYVALFHSQVNFVLDETPLTYDSNRRYYYMGFCVFAAQPPFSIQLMSPMPLVGPNFYNEEESNRKPRRIVFPMGLIVDASSNRYIVSYGKNDTFLFVAHFDRQKLLDGLQPPLPESWEGPPC